MRPLKGLVLSANKKTGLKVRLESGLITILPYDKHINVGQNILVKYDFIKNQATGIINSYSENNMPEPTKVKKGDDNDPEDPETIELLLNSWPSPPPYDGC